MTASDARLITQQLVESRRALSAAAPATRALAEQQRVISQSFAPMARELAEQQRVLWQSFVPMTTQLAEQQSAIAQSFAPMAAQLAEQQRVISQSFAPVAAQLGEQQRAIAQSFAPIAARLAAQGRALSRPLSSLAELLTDQTRAFSRSFAPLAAQIGRDHQAFVTRMRPLQSDYFSATSLAALRRQQEMFRLAVVLAEGQTGFGGIPLEGNETPTDPVTDLVALISNLPAAQREELGVLSLWVLVYLLAFLVTAHSHSLAAMPAGLALAVSIRQLLARIDALLDEHDQNRRWHRD